LQLEDASINLVDKEARLHTLGQRLTEHGLGLHRAAFNAIHHNHCSIGNSESGGHLRGEINVSWGINQVDQVRLGALAILRIVLEVQGHASGFDGHASLLLIGTGVGESSITSCLRGDDTGLANQRIRESGLSVIDVRNHGHGTDVVRFVHDSSDLVDGEIRHVLAIQIAPPNKIAENFQS
jgi:hypothetical protein